MRISKHDHKSFSFLCGGTILHIMDLSAILIDLIDLNSLNSKVLPQKWNPEVEKISVKERYRLQKPFNGWLSHNAYWYTCGSRSTAKGDNWSLSALNITGQSLGKLYPAADNRKQCNLSNRPVTAYGKPRPRLSLFPLNRGYKISWWATIIKKDVGKYAPFLFRYK